MFCLSDSSCCWSDSSWAGKLRLAQWVGAKAAVDRRETRRGLTAAKNSSDIFRAALRLFNNRKLFVKNSNFVYASLLRNLVFHCKFPLVEPPPWKLCRNTRYPYRSVGRRREGPSRVICHQVSSGQRAYNSVELSQLLVLMGAACWIAVSAVSAWKVPRTVLHVWSIF